MWGDCLTKMNIDYLEEIFNLVFMKNITPILIALLLILSILNFDYSILSDFQFTKSNVLEVLMILVCVIALITHFTTSSKTQNNTL
jgi:hypothetical protein